MEVTKFLSGPNARSSKSGKLVQVGSLSLVFAFRFSPPSALLGLVLKACKQAAYHLMPQHKLFIISQKLECGIRGAASSSAQVLQGPAPFVLALFREFHRLRRACLLPTLL